MNWWAINQFNDDGSRKYKYIINKGSSRSSKTWSLIEVNHRLCEQNSEWRATAWREDKQKCKKTVWKDFQKVLRLSDRLDIKARNKTESYYQYPNESTFEIHGTDDEETVHGLTQNSAWINEPYKISEDTFDQIDMRCDLMFLDYNPKKDLYIDKIANRDNAILIPSTYKDNPFCPEEHRIKIESYQPISFSKIGMHLISLGKEPFDYDIRANPSKYPDIDLEEYRRCLKNHEYGSANVYKWKVYGLGEKSEKPNKIYKGWKIISYEDFMKLDYPEFYGLDFGQTNPTALVHVKYNDATFYAHELLYKPEREMKIGLVNEVKQVVHDKSIPMICDDASPLKWKELRQAGFNARPAKKGLVIDGISLLQKCNVFYTPESKNLEEEYDEYEWDSDRLGLIDKPVKAKDHILDGFRYASVYAQRKLRIVVE